MSSPNSVEVEHVYSSPPSAVWRALTTPELHAKWWAKGDVQPNVGHAFHLDMGPWGNQPCVVTAVEPERLFAFTFAVGMLDTTITWRLAAEGGGTRLTLLHEGFKLDTPMGQRALDGMKAGWPSVLAKLDTTLTAAAPL